MAAVGGYSRRCGGDRNRQRRRPDDADFLVATGTATAIGSLPLSDADEAVDFVLRALPRLPAAPSLPTAPRRGDAGPGRLGPARRRGGRRRHAGVAPDQLDRHHPYAADDGAGIGGPPFATLQTFLRAVQGRPGPVKLQLTGPVTLGRALHDGGAPRRPGLPGRRRRRAGAGRGPAGRRPPRAARPPRSSCSWTSPGLSGNEHPALPAPERGRRPAPLRVAGVGRARRRQRRALLRRHRLVAASPRPGPGSCPCRSRAGAGQPRRDPRSLPRAGAAGSPGVPCPPTSRSGSRGDGLWRRLSDLWCALVREGCDAGRLRRQALITPACGLAGHGSSQADHSLRLAAELGRRVLGQAIGVRLQVGA